jgi:hypothetical protein
MHRLGILLALLAVGCDDDDLPIITQDLSAVADMRVRDAGPDFAGVLCTDEVCAPGLACCVQPTDGSIVASCQPPGQCIDGRNPLCDGPEDCSGAQVCCVRFVYQGSSITDPSIGCSADCPAEVTPMMMANKVVSRLCHSRDDCVGVKGEIFGGEVDFDGCCVRKEAPTRFCAPSSVDYMTLGKYTCQ